jgi:hypothetical protein
MCPAARQGILHALVQSRLNPRPPAGMRYHLRSLAVPATLRLGAKVQCLELVQLDYLPVDGCRIQCRLQQHEVKLLKLSQ